MRLGRAHNHRVTCIESDTHKISQAVYNSRIVRTEENLLTTVS